MSTIFSFPKNGGLVKIKFSLGNGILRINQNPLGWVFKIKNKNGVEKG